MSTPGKAKNADAYIVEYYELEPFPQPDNALKQVYALLERGNNQETWHCKCEGLEIIRRLLVHNPDVVLGDLHAVVLATINEVKNLRSSVSRVAMICLGDFYELLNKSLGTELDATVTALIMKAAGEASVFIREDCEKALDRMTPNVPGGR